MVLVPPSEVIPRHVVQFDAGHLLVRLILASPLCLFSRT